MHFPIKTRPEESIQPYQKLTFIQGRDFVSFVSWVQDIKTGVRKRATRRLVFKETALEFPVAVTRSVFSLRMQIDR